MRIPPDILLRRAETWRGQDLELDTLIGAMAVGDPSLFDVVGSVILTSVTDPDAIVYRQCALADCLEQPSIIRQMYDIAVEARESERKVYSSLFRDSPDSILSRSVKVLDLLVGSLKQLRQLADDHASKFHSEASKRERGDERIMTARDVQEFFERVATDWDTMRLSYYDERVIEKMAAVSGVDDTMTVADVGTGTGFVAAGIAPRVRRVLAADNSPAMLEVAKKNLKQLGIGNVELLVGDVKALPLEDTSVDAAFANMVLHHAEDPAAMLREMTRVVRPGGVVAVVDEVEHPFAWMREEHADVWLGFTRERVEGFFREVGLEAYGYESLGIQ